MTTRSVVHSTFVIERTYNASPARVFVAWADPASKRRWFAEGEGWEVGAFEVDFRVGGREHSRFRFKGGDGPQMREKGWRDLLERLDEELRRSL